MNQRTLLQSCCYYTTVQHVTNILVALITRIKREVNAVPHLVCWFLLFCLWLLNDDIIKSTEASWEMEEHSVSVHGQNVDPSERHQDKLNGGPAAKRKLLYRNTVFEWMYSVYVPPLRLQNILQISCVRSFLSSFFRWVLPCRPLSRSTFLFKITSGCPLRLFQSFYHVPRNDAKSMLTWF